jgi:hypothetical protein
MIREFKLINSQNQTLDLNDLDLFAYSPEGLGVTFANSYIGSNANFIPNGVALSQGQFKVQMLFDTIEGNPYQKFYNFVNFLNYQPLTLVYTTDAGEFQRKCQINELTKTEINEWHALDESFTLEFITPWFEYIEHADNPYVDQLGDGKIYRQVQDIPYTEVNLLPDPEITVIGSPTSTRSWTTSGNTFAWTVNTSGQYVAGYNVAILNQNVVLTGEASSFSQYLNAKNIDISQQTVGNVFLLEFYFKSDHTTDTDNDFTVEAYNSNNELIKPYRLLDRYGSISDVDTVDYFLDSTFSGEWIHCKITYKPTVDTDLISRFRFYFRRSDSEENYFTAPKLLQMEMPLPEDVDAYYVYSYVYEEDGYDFRKGYYPIVNDSNYFGASLGSPMEITIEATGDPVENPSWELWKGSQVIQNDKYLLTIPSGYKLIVSSFPEDQYVRLIAPDGTITNAYQNQDLTKTNFITIPIGPTTLIFDVGDGKITWRMRKERLLV